MSSWNKVPWSTVPWNNVATSVVAWFGGMVGVRGVGTKRIQELIAQHMVRYSVEMN